MTTYLSKLNPVPGFPEYTGPHKVGTVDVEIPVSELESPSPAPSTAKDIYTVQFRIFYPADPSANGRRITWLPAPQRRHVAAYTQFIGIRPIVAEMVSFLPRHLHYTSIPVHKNADILAPDTPNRRWPTMIFSHGLGGSRNAYSHLAGALASHGVVVICPEHRDGSAATSFIRIPNEQNRFFIHKTRREVPYNRISHDVSPEVHLAREGQLRIRLWEMGLVHSAVLGIDRGTSLTNLNTSTPSLEPFVGKMHVQEPGSIIFAGHSFGGTTITQFLKSTYYAGLPAVKAMKKPLYTPSPDSELCKQVTEKNITMLLDMWCFPLLAPNSSALFSLPLPAYADVPTAPGGNALLAVESESFFKWSEHLHTTARVLSPDPSAKVVTSKLYERPSGVRLTEPNFYYVQNSAHLSQSDFGILFPWLTKKVFDSVEPERPLRLNLRAQLQLLRANNVPVARTWVGDLVDGSHVGKKGVEATALGTKGPEDGVHDDKAIFDRSGNNPVEHWRWIDSIGLGSVGKTDGKKPANRDSTTARVEETNDDMEGEIEPHAESPTELATKIAT